MASNGSNGEVCCVLYVLCIVWVLGETTRLKTHGNKVYTTLIKFQCPRARGHLYINVIVGLYTTVVYSAPDMRYTMRGLRL